MTDLDDVHVAEANETIEEYLHSEEPQSADPCQKSCPRCGWSWTAWWQGRARGGAINVGCDQRGGAISVGGILRVIHLTDLKDILA